jgi:hypothetical protein
MDTSSPIFPPFEAFYIQSMLFNSTSAVQSIFRLERIFGKLPDRPSTEDVDRLPIRAVLDELQNMIVHAGAISRYFWPVRNEFNERGKALRDCFSVTEANSLFNRDLRNAIEHFDERLDKYLAADLVGCFFPEYVGERPSEVGVPGHFLRAYFVDTGEFCLLDKLYEIKPISDELLFVHSHLKNMDKEGGRFQPRRSDA